MTTEMTMIERVARAVHKAIDETMPKRVWQRWEDITPQARRAMYIRARATIRAMREPTHEMLLAPPAQDGDWSNERDIFWKGMIDAALEMPDGNQA